MPHATKKQLQLFKISEDLYSKSVAVYNDLSFAEINPKEISDALSHIELLCQETRKFLCSHLVFAGGRCAICNATHEEVKQYNEQYAEVSDTD